MEQKLPRMNLQTLALLVSLIIHLLILGIFAMIPFTQPPHQFTEVVILLDPPNPQRINPEDQASEQTQAPQVEEAILPEEIALPSESQPDPLPITPVQPLPPAPVQPAPSQPAPAPTQPVPRAATQPSPPVSQSRMPTDDEVLADVQGLMTTNRNQPLNPPQPQTTPNLSGFVAPQDSNQTDAQAQAFRQANPVTGPISQEVFNPDQQQGPPAPSVDPTQAVATLRAQMQQQYNQQATRPGPAPTQTSGFTDNRIQGELGNRGLVSADRLNLSRHIQQRGTNWPETITVRFEVDESGFSRILNESDFSLYSDLTLAVLRLFAQDGQMFLAAPGTTRQQGSITFRLQ